MDKDLAPIKQEIYDDTDQINKGPSHVQHREMNQYFRGSTVLLEEKKQNPNE